MQKPNSLKPNSLKPNSLKPNSLKPKTIEEAKQLIVEGQDTADFLSSLLREFKIKGFQIQNFGGVNELKPFLKSLISLSSFSEKVQVVGIIRDAEDNVENSWKSLQGTLKHVGLDVPDNPGAVIKGNPNVGAYLLPDNKKNGMLEDLCWDAVKNEPQIKCIDDFFDCLKSKAQLPKNIQKARVLAFLATRKKSKFKIGDAANAGYWNFDSEVYHPLKAFLKALSLATFHAK